MPMEEGFIMNSMSIDEIILGNLKKGQIITTIDMNKDKEDGIHYDIQFMRNLLKEVYQLYSSGTADKKKFVELFDKHHQSFATSKGDFLDRIADTKDELFMVEEKDIDKDGNVTIKLKKLDNAMRLKLITDISKKLASKLTKKQVIEILAEGIKRNNTTEQIQNMSKELKKNKDAKVEGKRGCYKLVVDKSEIMVSM
jgi:hypothetical protein